MVRKKLTVQQQGVALDSSCWLEYFSDSPRADLFAERIANTGALIVPIITLYEVYKVVLREFGSAAANQAVALMREGQVVDINLNLALSGAANGLPMPDSLIYATAQAHHALLWTQGQHWQRASPGQHAAVVVEETTRISGLQAINHA
ncbi:MAG: type II toxin-antitoxin system VapC family toxin [Burkholderiales bacterium]|nr:type II toxin-antitoxin system VapC family toxin [Burkholderiales bacterium]